MGRGRGGRHDLRRYDYYPLNTVSEWNYYGEFWRYSTAYVYAFEEWNTLYPGYTGGGWTPPCAYSGIYSLTDGWENYAGRVCPQSVERRCVSACRCCCWSGLVGLALGR